MKNNRSFFYRKLHSLLGLIPVGAFLIFHLFLNYSATYGEETYNNAAAFMMNLPFKIVLEMGLIFIPLLFHGIYGVVIALEAKNNVKNYSYEQNWYFYLQRVTGIIALLFVVWHVWQTRVQAALGVNVDFQMMAEIVASPLVLVLYIIGILSATFHFSNGLRTMLITWGITVSNKSQKFAKYLGIILFFFLSYVGLQAIFAFI